MGRTIVLGVIASLWLGAQALAQEEEVYGPEQSDFLLSFNASYSLADFDGDDLENDKVERIFALASGGYFLTRAHEVGIDLAVDYLGVEHGGDEQVYFLGAFYQYNWYATPRTSLFGGVHGGVEYADETGSSSQTDLAYGLQAGMRFWISPNFSFNVEPRWTHTELDAEGLDGRDEFGVFLGFDVVL